MKKQVSEIKQIIARFGEDVVTELRFANIYNDMFPNRDHANKNDILKEIITTGTSTELLNKCDKSNIKRFVEVKSKELEKRCGFSREESKKLLLCIAIASDRISLSDYNEIFGVNPNSPSGAPKNNPIKPLNNYRNTIIGILALALSGFCLIKSPLFYLQLLSNGWWPFWAIIVIALFHLVSIILPWGVFCNIRKDNRKLNPFVIGGFTTILAFGALFLAFGPFFIEWTENSLRMQYDYWVGLAYHKEYVFAGGEQLVRGFESPTILTLLVGLFCAAIELSSLAIIDLDGNTDIADVYKNEKRNFIKGLAVIALLISSVSIILFSMPYIEKKKYENELRKENENIAKEIQEIEKLKNTRSQESKDLSFKDFFLGEDIDQASAVLRDLNEYSFNNSAHRDLMIDSISYIQVVDSILYANTNWDNSEVEIYLYSRQKAIIAIEIVSKHNVDSLVNMYMSKYGKPEFMPKLKENYYDHYNNLPEIRVESIGYNGNVYSWTYRNALIQIRENNYSTCSIIYFDRATEKVLQDYLNEQKRIRQEQARQSEIENKRREEEERMRINKQKQKEQDNHRNAMQQI